MLLMFMYLTVYKIVKECWDENSFLVNKFKDFEILIGLKQALTYF